MSLSPGGGELCVHTEEPVLPAGAGDAAVPADGDAGAGLSAGLWLPEQAGWLQLLGPPQEKEEEELAGWAGEDGIAYHDARSQNP